MAINNVMIASSVMYFAKPFMRTYHVHHNRQGARDQLPHDHRRKCTHFHDAVTLMNVTGVTISNIATEMSVVAVIVAILAKYVTSIVCETGVRCITASTHTTVLMAACAFALW